MFVRVVQFDISVQRVSFKHIKMTPGLTIDNMTIRFEFTQFYISVLIALSLGGRYGREISTLTSKLFSLDLNSGQVR